MKKEKTMMALYAGCLAVLCACTESQELSNKEGIDEPVELQINPTMTLTGGGARDAASDPNNPTAFTKGATIGVFAVGKTDGTTAYGKDNNYAVYTLGDGSAWSVGSGESDTHIYLTSEVATIYAVSPSSATSAPSGTVSADATVEVETFAGKTDAIDTSNSSDNLITAAQSATNAVNVASGEKDYMYAGGNTQPTASNGAGTNAPTSSVDLDMHHALAMVSFRVYKEDSYKGAGHLTKIQMKNKGTSSGSPLKLEKPGSSAKANMKIGDGTIALGDSKEDITYTRFIHQTRGNLYTTSSIWY